MFVMMTALALGAPAADEVTSLPGFGTPPFKVYSGYLDVPGPFALNDYDSLYVFSRKTEAAPAVPPLRLARRY